MFLALIAKRRAAAEKPNDLLSLLLAARDEATGLGMNDVEVKDEVHTLLLAGHETTAAGRTWAWYLLARRRASRPAP